MRKKEVYFGSSEVINKTYFDIFHDTPFIVKNNQPVRLAGFVFFRKD